METSTQPASGALGQLDRYMSENPWHPRIVPFLVFILLLLVIQYAESVWLPSLPFLYAVQAAVPAWLLWRYRALTPELTVRFHWLAIPSALFLLVAWVGLGWWFAGEWDARWAALQQGELLGRITEAADAETALESLGAQSPTLLWLGLAVKFISMAVVVPLFEELFTRSALLRGLSNGRRTLIGLVQLAGDLPVLGDAIMHSWLGRKATGSPHAFTFMFERTHVGKVTFFGLLASTTLFMLNHGLRDWAGCIACGLVWCAMVAYHNRPALPEEKRSGLGPIVWSHGLVNAMLVGYTVVSGDWQFL